MYVYFHLTGNAMGAVGKIMWSLILIETGLCKQGTVNKDFASAGDYYQSMREHK